jgi:hypothetical protein
MGHNLLGLTVLTILLLVGRTEDPKTSGLTASFEVISVALNNLTLLILSSIWMVLDLFKAFGNYF